MKCELILLESSPSGPKQIETIYEGYDLTQLLEAACFSLDRLTIVDSLRIEIQSESGTVVQSTFKDLDKLVCEFEKIHKELDQAYTRCRIVELKSPFDRYIIRTDIITPKTDDHENKTYIDKIKKSLTNQFGNIAVLGEHHQVIVSDFVEDLLLKTYIIECEDIGNNSVSNNLKDYDLDLVITDPTSEK